jgi:aryl-alcohol dehydrogenase-like predicted oxidoreductase
MRFITLRGRAGDEPASGPAEATAAAGPALSVVGLGTWGLGGAYGPPPQDRVVVETIRAALSEGVNWIDTAEVYGAGRVEQLVGEAIRGRRDEVFVATKLADHPVGSGYHPVNIRPALLASLRRLGTDRVDLYQLHRFPDRETIPIEDTWGAMAGLVDEGLARHIGLCNVDARQMQRCLEVRTPLSLQAECSLLQRRDLELFARCRARAIDVFAYGVLGFGLLTDAVRSGTRFESHDWRSGRTPSRRYYEEHFRPGVLRERLRTAGCLRGVELLRDMALPQLAVAWALHQPGVSAVLVGSRSAARLIEDIGGADIRLEPEHMRQIACCLTDAAASPR